MTAEMVLDSLEDGKHQVKLKDRFGPDFQVELLETPEMCANAIIEIDHLRASLDTANEAFLRLAPCLRDERDVSGFHRRRKKSRHLAAIRERIVRRRGVLMAQMQNAQRERNAAIKEANIKASVSDAGIRLKALIKVIRRQEGDEFMDDLWSQVEEEVGGRT